MKAFVRRPVRVTFRLAWLVAEVSFAVLNYPFHVTFRRQNSASRARTLWLQQACRRVLRILNVAVQARGPVPSRGLLVSNHLSYLDILVISSITPTVFVSKSEVKAWPVFGWFARMSGTLFVERSRRSDVSRLNTELGRVLADGALVALFPEGTSSDGSVVLPFKSSLLDPVTRLEHPLTVGCIEYEVPDGRAGEDVCYWGDMTLVPHLVNLLSKRSVAASVSFTANRAPLTCRKSLARHLHSEVVRLKEGGALPVIA